MEKLTFKNSKGDNLVGVLSNPTGSREKPIIILCHGFSSSKESNTYTNLEKSLNSLGFSTFRFDFYGHGESEGKFEDITLSEAVDDALNAIKFIKGLGYAKIGLVGSSFGGMASAIAASKSDDLILLVLNAPVSNFREKRIISTHTEKDIKEWKKKGYTYYIGKNDKKFRLNLTFLEDAMNISVYEVAGKINVPTLIVHGGKDKSVPLEQSRKTAGLIKDCRLEIVEGADHRYTKPPRAFEKMLELISGFIIERSGLA